MDVVGAFLQSEIDKDIFVRLPAGLEQFNADGVPLVMKLKKGLYGLRQGACLFNQKLHRILEANGFVQTTEDDCVYCRASDCTTLVIWVNDMLMIAPNTDATRALPQRQFKKKDVAPPSTL